MKNQFWPTHWGFRGNVRTPPIARWKPVVNFLFVIIELFRYLLRLGRLSGNLSKSAFFEEGESLWAQISDGRRRRPPTTVGARNLEWLPFRAFVWYQNTRSVLFGFVTKHACGRRIDGRTDRQNYDCQNHPHICSCGKNQSKQPSTTRKQTFVDAGQWQKSNRAKKNLLHSHMNPITFVSIHIETLMLASIPIGFPLVPPQNSPDLDHMIWQFMIAHCLCAIMHNAAIIWHCSDNYDNND